jgi:hypothetical protein
MTDDQIKHMTERFLNWRIPTDRFHPDCGVSVQRPNYGPNVEWMLTGTNLFDYALAEEMVRHMVEGLNELAGRITPEWCEAMAPLEADHEVGAGFETIPPGPRP